MLAMKEEARALPFALLIARATAAMFSLGDANNLNMYWQCAESSMSVY
ncbi:hypothetical protein H8F18_20495 [Vibrio fluvialis]|nr:hypothetical protein [Vibrio fluvialis]MBL4244799.1 hypothetical protein [Vibrio fluvialis]MBL4253711.1 hypothetical protein [Vibrio fluvialis]